MSYNYTMRIGLVVYGNNNEYYNQLMSGIRKFCNSRKIDILVFIAGAPNWLPDDFGYHNWSLTGFINSNNIDGLILATGTMCHYVSIPEMQSIVNSFRPLPMVSLNVKIPGVPSVLEKAEKGFSELIDHVISIHSVKRILFLTSQSASKEIVERKTILKSVLKKHNLVLEKKNIIYGEYTFYSAENAILEYIRKNGKNFDAVVCITDEMAYGVISGLKKNGFSVPEDVIVTGFDNTSLSKSSNPTLSSVEQHVVEQGTLCAEILYRQILGEKVKQSYIVDTSCIKRQSCGCVKKTNGLDVYIDENGKLIRSSSGVSFNATLKFLAVQEQIQTVQYHVNRIQGNLSLEDLSKNLKVDFESLGIQKAAICLFKSSFRQTAKDAGVIPKKARVYFAFDDEETLDYCPDSFFNCEKTILPENFRHFLTGCNTVMSLYHGEYMYGYIVVKLGELESFVYTLFCSIIAKSICSAFEVSRRRAENLSLTKSNNDLSILSYTDELTGIFNRRGFMKIAQSELKAAVGAKKSGLVIFGDIDGLKKINDTYGHDAGDRAILAEVELLKKTFREADTIGRLGGDEFAILSIAISFEIFSTLKKRLDSLCEEWNKTSGEKFSLSISLGAVPFDKENSDLLKLMKLADIEQYKEKEKHKKEKR